jgi:hypothetical protein
MFLSNARTLHKLLYKFALLFIIPIFLCAGFMTACNEADPVPNPTRSLLENRPLAARDLNLFSTAAYTLSIPMAAASGPVLTNAEARPLLEAYLGEGNLAVATGLALYDDPVLMEKVASPALRAGLIGLLGTAGEPAIDFILHARTAAGLPVVARIAFATAAWGGTHPLPALIQVNEQKQLTILFNPAFKAESPFLFTSLLAHEALHSDALASDYEEIVAQAIETAIYLEQLALHGDLAKSGTEMARRLNTSALVRLNSGAGAKLGLFSSNNNQQVLPGSQLHYTSWYGQFAVTDLQETPGNTLLNQMLGQMEAVSTTPLGLDFNMLALRYIDEQQANISEEELMQVTAALNLYSQQ